MKKHNSMLKSARVQKSWTPEFVSEKVGVRLNTSNRWETGSQLPRHASLDALCKVFEMSPEALGFAELPYGRRNIAHLLADQEATPSPGLNTSEQPAQSEALALWSLGITSCWQLYMIGGQAELERLLPSYLTNLSRPTLYPNPEQRVAARLTAQAYQLIALLELQRGDFVTAQKDATQALVYSQLSKDWNLYIASQIRLASIFTARKRIGSALNAYNDALRRVTETSDDISPILHSWIFAGLAEIQATMGREKEALQFLQLAFAVFPAPPERIRAEFLQQKAYTSCVLGNMTQSCIYLEAAARAAQEIESDLAFSEVYAPYEHMLALWGQEPRVKALSRLFQK